MALNWTLERELVLSPALSIQEAVTHCANQLICLQCLLFNPISLPPFPHTKREDWRRGRGQIVGKACCGRSRDSGERSCEEATVCGLVCPTSTCSESHCLLGNRHTMFTAPRQNLGPYSAQAHTNLGHKDPSAKVNENEKP